MGRSSSTGITEHYSCDVGYCRPPQASIMATDVLAPNRHPVNYHHLMPTSTRLALNMFRDVSHKPWLVDVWWSESRQLLYKKWVHITDTIGTIMFIEDAPDGQFAYPDHQFTLHVLGPCQHRVLKWEGSRLLNYLHLGLCYYCDQTLSQSF